ncbi:MAG: hypothetical protein N2505_00265 [Endomicrobia bacterium]|nr:hypothetical protein [Endomicrobiia bacterium]
MTDFKIDLENYGLLEENQQVLNHKVIYNLDFYYIQHLISDILSNANLRNINVNINYIIQKYLNNSLNRHEIATFLYEELKNYVNKQQAEDIAYDIQIALEKFKLGIFDENILKNMNLSIDNKELIKLMKQQVRFTSVGGTSLELVEKYTNLNPEDALTDHSMSDMYELIKNFHIIANLDLRQISLQLAYNIDKRHENIIVAYINGLKIYTLASALKKDLKIFNVIQKETFKSNIQAIVDVLKDEKQLRDALKVIANNYIEKMKVIIDAFSMSKHTLTRKIMATGATVGLATVPVVGQIASVGFVLMLAYDLGKYAYELFSTTGNSLTFSIKNKIKKGG